MDQLGFRRTQSLRYPKGGLLLYEKFKREGVFWGKREF
jgi:hypothetical protein